MAPLFLCFRAVSLRSCGNRGRSQAQLAAIQVLLHERGLVSTRHRPLHFAFGKRTKGSVHAFRCLPQPVVKANGRGECKIVLFSNCEVPKLLCSPLQKGEGSRRGRSPGLQQPHFRRVASKTSEGVWLRPCPAHHGGRAGLRLARAT